MSLRRYTGLTGKGATFSGIGFTHLRLPRRSPFGPPEFKSLLPLGMLAAHLVLFAKTGVEARRIQEPSRKTFE